MSSIKSRLDKLYAGSISAITSKITVTKDGEILKEKTIGNNKNKMIQILVKF